MSPSPGEGSLGVSWSGFQFSMCSVSLGQLSWHLELSLSHL